MRTHYHALGVHRGSTAIEVGEAFKRLAKVYHPDAGGNAEAFSALSAAAAVLRGKSKVEYDALLQFQYPMCGACKGIGYTRKSKGFTEQQRTRCEPCGGSGVMV